MSWNPDDLSGFSLPGYQLIRQLGQGGMATVYLALQESVDREVALKVMSPFLASDQSFTDRFLREARIAAQLHHPHIVTVHDVGVHDTYHFIAMQYLPGGKLSDLDLQALSVERALVIVKEIAQALAYAHEKGFVHRDVKPDNILFDEKGASCLTDFGIARAADSNTQMTATGSIIGTPHYMSPEQARGKKVDHRADLYSLGIVLYQLLVGEVPYQSEESLTVCIMHVNDPLPRLPQCLAPLQPILDRLLAKDPQARFEHAQAFLESLASLDTSGALDECKGYTPATLPHVVENTTRKNTPEIVPTPRPETRRQVKSPTRRPLPWKWLLAGVVALLLLWTGRYLLDQWEWQQQQVREEARLAQQLTRLNWLVEQQRFMRPAGDNALEVAQTLWQKYPENTPLQAAIERMMRAWLDAIEQRKEWTVLDVWQQAAKQFSLNLGPLAMRAASLRQQGENMDAGETEQSEPPPSGQTSQGWQAIVEALLQSSNFNDLLRAWSLLQQAPPEMDATQVGALRQSTVDRLRQQLQSLLDSNDSQQMALRLARLQTLPRLYQKLDGAWWHKQLENQQQQGTEDELLAGRIRQLLDEGYNFMAQMQLTRPEGANAQERFEQVLALDPENSKAKKGLQKVLEKLLELADKAMEAEDLARASRYLKSARGLGFSSDLLKTAEEKLAHLQEKRTYAEPSGSEQTVSTRLPADIPALLAYAEQHKRRQPEQAIQAWRAVLRQDPANLEASDALTRMAQALALDAEFLLEQEDVPEAQKRLQWAMLADPEHPDVKSVRRKFKRIRQAQQVQQKSSNDDVSQLKQAAQAQRLLNRAQSTERLEEMKALEQELATIGNHSERIEQAMNQRAQQRIEQLLQANDLQQADAWLQWLEHREGGTAAAAPLRLRWRAKMAEASDTGQ